MTPPPRPPWRVGFEIELLAPPGRDRLTLATALAALRPGGRVRRRFHQESEPSAVPGHPIFHNLTLGFDAVDARGALIARCVDDLTLQADLDRDAPPRPGWLRLVSDDARLLRLAARHAALDGDLDDLASLVAPVAALFGTAPEPGPGGMVRVVDDLGASVLICAPLPGERERPCELITPPLDDDRAARLGELVHAAAALDFTLPVEGAAHVHFDAAALRDARVLSDLVRFFAAWGPALGRLVGKPAHLRRAGAWPAALVDALSRPAFAALPWADAERELRALAPSKYCDFNLANLAFPTRDKDTFEVRVLPTTLDVDELLAGAALFEAILHALCAGPLDLPAAPDASEGEGLATLLTDLPLAEVDRRSWQGRLDRLKRA